jgi:hypothetical protein
MRVRDLKNWPPEPCGAYKRSSVSPSAEQAIIQKVLHMYDIWITFSCEFEGNDHTYDLQTHDKMTPPKLKVILENNIGKSLLSIGAIEIPKHSAAWDMSAGVKIDHIAPRERRDVAEQK